MDMDNEDADATDAEYVPDKDDIMDDSDADEKNATLSRKVNKKNVWSFFKTQENHFSEALCIICNTEITFTSILDLISHVIENHGQLDSITAARYIDGSYTPKMLNKSRRSKVWNYFDVIDHGSRLAKCQICQKTFSFMSSVSNLMKHVRKVHKKENASSDDEEKGVKRDEALTGQSSAVWAYFKCLDQRLKIASCLICKKRINYNDDKDLSRHLSRKHPRVDLGEVKSKPKKLMITENGDIFEIDEDAAKQEPVENQDHVDNVEWSYNTDEVDALDTEYLEEKLSEAESEDYKPIKKKPKLVNVALNSLSTQQESSLDIFGRYMVSLLQTLPKHKSDQLQVDFIKQIMAAQISNDKKHMNRSKLRRIINTRYPSQSIQNTRYSSTSINDDTRVTSNSEVQRLITSDGEIQRETGINDEQTVGDNTSMNDD